MKTLWVTMKTTSVVSGFSRTVKAAGLRRIAIAVVMLVIGAGIVIAAAPRQRASSPATADTLMGAALHQEEVEGNLEAAIATYKKVIADARASRPLAATALVHLGRSYEKIGDADAGKAYERVVREFADQTASAATARTRLAAMQAAAVAQVGQTVRLVWSDLGRGFGGFAVGPLSADGRYLSFSKGAFPDGSPAGGRVLGILDLKAGRTLATTDLGDDGGVVESSVVSPDGRQVAYIWDMSGRAGGEELRVLQVNGGKAAKSRSVHLNRSYMGVGGWSPDGKSVVVVREVGDATTAQIAVISIADGTVRVLKENVAAGGVGAPSFSPDGRYVAYQRRDGQIPAPRDIFVLTADGKETRVVEDPGDDRSPMWSPDGSHIVFLSDRTGNVSLWMVPVAGGMPSGPAKLVKANVGSLYPLGMTRSGGLYYIAGSAMTNVYTAELDATLNAAAGPSMATNRYINSNFGGVWSPDGQSLAYLASSPPGVASGVAIRIRSVKTGDDREVSTQVPINGPVNPNTQVPLNGPVRWFPDGQSLLVTSRDVRLLNGQVGYYRVNIATGHAELLHQTALRYVASIRPDLSPDGKTIFYLETPQQPVRFDIDSRRETRLPPVRNSLPRSQWPLSLAVSPDGAQLAYLGAGSVVVAPAAGGEPREVIRFSGDSDPDQRASGLGLAWSTDQRYLFFVKPDARAIWRVPLAGGEAENIGISMNKIRALRMHPDGRRIAFDSVIDAPSELWALENFLPKTRAAR